VFQKRWVWEQSWFIRHFGLR